MTAGPGSNAGNYPILNRRLQRSGVESIVKRLTQIEQWGPSARMKSDRVGDTLAELLDGWRIVAYNMSDIRKLEPCQP